ncbi:MAG: FmdE family protein [Egibacteraceae bacterium]|jgi:formylmethanofuran dehydrogenase subunit E
MTEHETVTKVAEFHGHMCPGLALGIRAAEIALAEVGPHSSDEEVVAIVETDMCGVDAVQYLTGCTYGKGNLVHRDHGKNVFTFLRRSDDRAVRVSMRPGAFGPDDPEREELRAKIRAGAASGEERARFWQMQRERSEDVLAAPLAQLYEVREVAIQPPPTARIHASVECAFCGEPTMETRVRRLHGQQLCLPCFEQGLAGRSPVPLTTAAFSGENATSAAPPQRGP